MARSYTRTAGEIPAARLLISLSAGVLANHRGTLDEIHLTVKDSGAGFDREAAKTSPGLGLISMGERVKLVNGALTIESQLQRGTIIHARVPCR
jgi:signal transduction histidine kinase